MVLHHGLCARPQSHLLCGIPGLDSAFFLPVWWFLALLILSQSPVQSSLSHVQNLACYVLSCSATSPIYSPTASAIAPAAGPQLPIGQMPKG